MEKNNLIIIGIIILAFYLLQPTPYCKISDEIVKPNHAVYTEQEVLDLGEITATNLHLSGTSMLPTIQENSQCLCISKDTYSVGDIVFFFAKINNEWKGIAHRIVLIDYRGIFTKGDNNDFLDNPMEEENIGCYIPEVSKWKTLI